MANKTKGFIEIPSFRNNVPGQTAQFGELSLRSLTYSREQGEYPSTSGNTIYRSFIAEDAAGVAMEVDSYVQTGIFAVADEIYTLYSGNQLGNPIVDETDLATHLSSDTTVTAANVANIVVYNKIPDGSSQWMPGSISFSVDNAGGTETTKCRIWFSDADFTSYDEYEIVMVPPLDFSNGDVLDDLNTSINGVSAIVQPNVTPDAILDHINAASSNARPTYQSLYPLTWHDANDPGFTYQTPWIFLGYGPDANIDANIREAIRNYITDNTNLSTSIWKNIYPDIYNKMEFYIIPYWDKVAITQAGSSPILYSSLLTDMSSISLRGKQFSAEYSPAEAEASLTLMPIFYRSLLTIVTGSSNNKSGMIHISDAYPDYAFLPTSDTDFDRMTPDTKAFVLALNTAVDYAEDLSQATQLSGIYHLVQKGGFDYVGFSVNKMDFFVLSGPSLTQNI